MAGTFLFALLAAALSTCAGHAIRALQVDEATPNEWNSRDGLHTLSWQLAGTFLQTTARARPRGINPPGWVAFGMTDNGKMVSSGGATLVLVGLRPTTLAAPIGRRLQNGLPPPPGGAENDDLQVYLVKEGGVATPVQKTDPGLRACGIDVDGAGVQASGTAVELIFPITIQQEGETTCIINGITVPTFLTKTKHHRHIVMAHGSEPTFGQQNEDDWEDAYDVLCDQPDGNCTGEGGIQGALGAVAGLALIALGYKFYMDKQAEAGAAPPAPGAPNAMYPAAQQPAAPQAASPWTAQVDPGSGATYYLNSQTGESSWTPPPGF